MKKIEGLEKVEGGHYKFKGGYTITKVNGKWILRWHGNLMTYKRTLNECIEVIKKR